MKSIIITPLFAAIALAQIQGDYGPNCGIRTAVPSDLNTTEVQTIGQALFDINATSASLNDSINAFDPARLTTIVDLQVASQTLINQIISSNSTVAALPVLADTEDNQANAYELTVFVASLACNVNRTVDNFIRRKGDIVDVCFGPIALQQIQAIFDDANEFTNVTISKIPEFIRPDAESAVNPIRIALSSGLAAYITESTTPASCATSATSSTTGGTTGITTGITTGGGVYPTGSSTTGGVYPTPTTTDDECEDDTSTTTGGVYPTGSATTGGVYPTPTTTDDCEDDTSTTGGVYPTTTDDCEDDTPTTGGGSYPTTGGGGGGNGGGSYTTTSDDCEDDVPTTGAGNGGGGGGGGSYPTTAPQPSSYTPITPVAPPATSGPAVQPTPTTAGTITTYTGAAVANHAGSGLVGVAAFAAAVVAAL